MSAQGIDKPEYDDDDFFVRVIDRWLESKGVTLWADWEIIHPERRRLAAQWFLGELRALDLWERTVLTEDEVPE